MNTTSRNGKIARLPREIRQELNERLSNGETAKSALTWLNGLPEVLAVLSSQFEGALIREQNISEWRKGGYRDWKQREAAIEVAVRMSENAARRMNEERAKPRLSEALTLWLAREYAVATRELAESEEEEKQALLRQMTADMMQLRRIERRAAKLRRARNAFVLEKEREAMRRARRKEEREERYRKPEVPMTPEEFEVRAPATFAFGKADRER